MWIYTAGGSFFSIVQDKNRPGYLCVRARTRGVIEKLLPGAKVLEGAGSDYAFRSSVNVETAISAFIREIRAVSYSNYKNTITDRKKHDTLFKIWEISKELETP